MLLMGLCHRPNNVQYGLKNNVQYGLKSIKSMEDTVSSTHIGRLGGVWEAL